MNYIEIHIACQKVGVHIKKCMQCTNEYCRGFLMKKYIEERAIEIANYIIENNATVRQAAKQFGISKSTVHVVVTI